MSRIPSILAREPKPELSSGGETRKVLVVAIENTEERGHDGNQQKTGEEEDEKCESSRNWNWNLEDLAAKRTNIFT